MSMLTSFNQGENDAKQTAAYSLLLGEYEAALKKIQCLESTQQVLDIKIASLEEEITRLKEQVRLMQHRRFGKKSESKIGEPLSEPMVTQVQNVAGYTRKKRLNYGRTIDTSILPRHKFYHDLSEENKNCRGCHNTLEKIGEEISEKLEVLPMRLYVAEHIRSKYSCRTCHTVEMAPKPKAPIPKALAGGSLITDVVVSKYQYHLPLYRQSKILESYNAPISDNTLGSWVMQSGAGLMPVYQCLWEVVLGASYLQVDETPVKILKSNKNGYLWTYFAPHVGKGLVIFELSATRSGTIPENRLATFTGRLQTDGYAGYNPLRKRKTISGLGCMTHSRRKFSEVLKITNNPHGVAAELIERLKPLYALEERMREQNLSFHTRKRLRQKQAWPILKALHPWLKQQLVKTPPKSKLAGAIQYMLSQWPYLIAYLRHGDAEIDNNWVENLIRPTVLGKKNWLFMSHEDSGLIHALWYSLVQSAVLNGLNPRLYVHYLLSQIHVLRTKTVDPMTLLPHIIDHDHLRSFANDQIALAKEILGNTS